MFTSLVSFILAFFIRRRRRIFFGGARGCLWGDFFNRRRKDLRETFKLEVFSLIGGERINLLSEAEEIILIQGRIFMCGDLERDLEFARILIYGSRRYFQSEAESLLYERGWIWSVYKMFLVGDIGEILSKRILKSRGEDAKNIKYNNVIALRLFYLTSQHLNHWN